MADKQFAGAWALVAFEVHHPDGRIDRPIGDEPAGMLMYDPAGYMSVHLARPDRPRFLADDQFAATPYEVDSAFGGYRAYCGRFSVDHAAGVVTHHVESSLFPNWEGGDQPRRYAFEGDRLVLTSPVGARPGVDLVTRLVWRRRP